ncbi:unnamed protein product [Danaus chrysippus]|uniref:(African queen) hypothetical protein n=1 Tax=Danaus chrysippus TaxID=151541 RepID=A0A8J2QI15_9NEOP|nr:unnamed protein product [Danaus chrysippus]
MRLVGKNSYPVLGRCIKAASESSNDNVGATKRAGDKELFTMFESMSSSCVPTGKTLEWHLNVPSDTKTTFKNTVQGDEPTYE